MKVKKGIIMAAGFGSRMLPITATTPKPLVKVYGVRFIDTLINKMLSAGIKDIYVVRGYLKDQFDELLVDYPFIKFIDNDLYDKENNISSAMKVLDLLGNAYLCEADFLVTGDDVITSHQDHTNYIGTPVEKTDDWCFDVTSKGRVVNYRKGGENCYQAFGVSYWTPKDAKLLKELLTEMYKYAENKQKFWEMCIFDNYKNLFNIQYREVKKDSIVEIDSYTELCAMDRGYRREEVKTYFAANTNPDILKMSSSGGVFHALASYVIEQGGVVFGAAWNKDWLVDMKAVDNLDDLTALMGSKYVQANVKSTFRECKQYLDAGRLVLYTGVPCQLHALNKFLGKNYSNLYMVDVCCHGLMPINIWQDYLKSIQREGTEITDIRFREKKPTWYDFFMTIKYSDDYEYSQLANKNKYFNAFLSDKYLKKSCYDCKYKNQYSISDLCIGDPWGIKTNDFNITVGVSFIKSFTAKGDELLKAVEGLKIVPAEYDGKNTNGGMRNKIGRKPEEYDKSIFDKKVAIITLSLHSNIGGILQGYALAKKINSLDGYSAEVLSINSAALLPFAAKNVPLRIFEKSEDMMKIKGSDYDIYVVGSDQVWRKCYSISRGNFSNYYIDVPFLRFTNNWTKTRLSYAASFGVSGIQWEYQDDENKDIAKLLGQFNAVSVRETKSKADCQEKLGLDVKVCVDPTLLISKETYLDLCKDVEEKHLDVGTYILDTTSELEDKIAQWTQNNNGVGGKLGGQSVEEWLAGFRDADCIITDSYHGCVFSIIFGKPFICLYNRARGGARFDSLVELCGIKTYEKDGLDLNTAEYNRVNTETISSLIAESEEFLCKSLNSKPIKMSVEGIKERK